MYLFAIFFFSSRRRHTRCALVTGVQTCALPIFVNTGKKGSTEDVALDAETIPRPRVSALTDLAVGHIKLCPAIGFDQIVGGRYKLHILFVLNLGPHRYGEIGRSLRSEEHTSDLQSLMRISYAVFFLKKKNNKLLH